MTTYAIAIATNLNQSENLNFALSELEQLGECRFSLIYEIPCRDGVGADYWNLACILQSSIELYVLVEVLKHLENATGRKRPSHSISLDVDLIAWGNDLTQMQFNQKKLPLENDVIIPLSELWSHSNLVNIKHNYRMIEAS